MSYPFWGFHQTWNLSHVINRMNLENYNEVRHQLVENSAKDDKALQELVEAVLRERAFLR
jgi:hypothetical protein